MILQPQTPRPYQQEGIEFLRSKKRAFLCDKPGLGKTLQGMLAAEKPVLVACPGYLQWHWGSLIKQNFPNDRIIVADSRVLARRKAQLEPEADWYIVNIELLRTMPTWFKHTSSLSTFIVDEAHHLRGRTSQQNKGGQYFADRIERVYLLTATPIYNQPDDLFALFRLLYPREFGSYYAFLKRYCITIDMPFGFKIVGLRKNWARQELLKIDFAKYALERSRKQVGVQLPNIVETVLPVQPPSDWYKRYAAIKRTYRADNGSILGSPIEVLEHLRSLTAHQKFGALCELILDTTLNNGGVIFTWHVGLAKAIADKLQIPAITGEMSPLERVKVAQENDLFTATIASLSEGVDLSRLNNVVFYEHDWVPGRIYQALSRVHRPGSEHNDVNIFHICVRKSVDDTLYNAYKTREANAQKIMEAALED